MRHFATNQDDCTDVSSSSRFANNALQGVGLRLGLGLEKKEQKEMAILDISPDVAVSYNWQ